MDEALWDRLVQHGQRIGECLIWQRALFSNGYGAVRVGNKQKRVHRVAYELWVGPIPEGMLVCHSCDTPACFEPQHLWLGTCRDNHQDREAKGRGRRLRGEENPDHKLNEDQVREIRQLCATGEFSQQEIAERFCVAQSLVSLIHLKHRWKHLS